MMLSRDKNDLYSKSHVCKKQEFLSELSLNAAHLLANIICIPVSVCLIYRIQSSHVCIKKCSHSWVLLVIHKVLIDLQNTVPLPQPSLLCAAPKLHLPHHMSPAARVLAQVEAKALTLLPLQNTQPRMHIRLWGHLIQHVKSLFL